MNSCIETLSAGFICGLAVSAVCGCGPQTTLDVRGIRSIEGRQVASLHSTRCMVAGTTSGQSAVLPPFDARCSTGPGRRCKVAEVPVEPWQYVFPPDDAAWREWADLGYVPPDGTHFHKQFGWKLDADECLFTVTLYGDLDGDNVYSTYVRLERYAADGQVWTDFQEQSEE